MITEIDEAIEFLEARQSHLGGSRERCNEDEREAWDKYDEVVDLIRDQRDLIRVLESNIGDV